MSEKIIAKGKRAEDILNDPVITEALEAIRVKQLVNIETSNPADAVKREHCYSMLKAIEELRVMLNTYRNDGVFEQNKIDKNR